MKLGVLKWKWRLFWSQTLSRHYLDRRLKWRFRHLWTHQVFSWFAWRERLNIKHQKMPLFGSKPFYCFMYTKVHCIFTCFLFLFLRVSLYFDMVMFWDQNAGWNHNIKIVESSLESVEEFKYMVTTLTNKNSIQEEIKSRFQSGLACCRLVQNLSSSSLVSKNLKINLYLTAFKLFFMLPVWNFVRDGPLNRWACLTTCLTINVYKWWNNLHCVGNKWEIFQFKKFGRKI